MEPVFTLQWSEFVVAQRLQALLPRKDGYSVLVPLSRQEKGLDLAVLRHAGTSRSATTTIQVKASRTYVHEPPKREGVVRYRFNSWFNRFDVPDQADYVILVSMYPPDLGQTKRIAAAWYKDCSLIFSRDEMRQLIANCNTVGGKPDRMFGFGFNDDMSRVVLNRGDKDRSGTDYSTHLLERRLIGVMNG